jgi:uncharacterized protein
VAVLLLVLATAASAELPIPPAPARRVNDYAGALSSVERERLEAELSARERESSNQVVVAIFPSLAGENLESFSIRLAQAWRVGQKGLDNGVIFLIFLQERKTRLEVGYGLEAVLTDAIAAPILRDVVAPRFREGKLAEGIAAGMDAVARAIAGTYTAAPRLDCYGFANYLTNLGACAPQGTGGALIAGLVLILGVIASARRSRRRGWTGGRRGWTVSEPGGFWSSGGPNSGTGLSWSFRVSSGSSGGGSSSSSDSFSGGGGSFGGGGASGGW